LSSPHFQALTIKYRGIASRIVTDVLISDAFDPAHPPTPPLKKETTKALWDTGANRSAITPSLAKALGLASTGTQIVGHFGGSSLKPTYLVNVYLSDSVMIYGVIVSECDETPNFGFILGMEIITSGDFSITNVAGKTCMSFRCPSIAEIDYFKEHSKIQFAGVGRNDPCPCGKKDASGNAVKFKKCHGSPV
jgi:aspartyl protease